MTPRSEEQDEFEDVRYELADGIGVITLDRPPVNALRTRTYLEFRRAFLALDEDSDCRVVVMRSGNERIFSAGADIKELPMPEEADELRQRLARDVFERVMRATKPVVCAVNGPALGGGCALAAAADIRVASEDARFGLPEINVGRCGGARHLMRLLPQTIVRWMYFTGETIDAGEAHRLGMVKEVVPAHSGLLDIKVMELAANVASKSPIALRFAKEALDLAEEMHVSDGYRVEQQFSLRLAKTADAEEGARAFRERRAPEWAGLQ